MSSEAEAPSGAGVSARPGCVGWIRSARFWGGVVAVVVSFAALALACSVVSAAHAQCHQKCLQEALPALAIAYSAMGAFVGVMIPLHYTISLDIVARLRGTTARNTCTGQEWQVAERSLRWYCHTAEAVVFAFGLFGVGALSQGALCLWEFATEQPPCAMIRKVVGCLLVFALGTGLGRNIVCGRSQWGLRKADCPWMFRAYLGFVSLGGVFCIAWSSVIYTDPGLTSLVPTALSAVLLTFYYALWVTMRIVFAPVTNAYVLETNRPAESSS